MATVQTSFAFFTVEKNGNSVDVKYNDNLVIKLPMCNIWNKDEINKRLYQQKESIMNIYLVTHYRRRKCTTFGKEKQGIVS